MTVAVAGALMTSASMLLAAMNDRSVKPGLLVALFALSVLAAQRESVFSDETALSGSVVVIMAATVGLENGSALMPVLCAFGAGFHLAHLRSRACLKMLVNVGAMTGPALVASEFHRAISTDGSSPRALIAIVAAVITYWLLNNLFVGLALVFVQQHPPRQFVWDLVRSETVMLVFALGGALCGLVMIEVSQWTGIAALVALLVALDVFVISSPVGPTTLRSAWKMMVTRVAGAAVGGVVGAAVPKLVTSAVIGALLGGVIGIAAGLATVTVVAMVRLRIAGMTLDRRVLVGFVIAEVALPGIGTVSGVVGAFAGIGPAIATAAALVVVAAGIALWRRRAIDEEPIDEELLLATVAEAMFDGLPHPANRG